MNGELTGMEQRALERLDARTQQEREASYISELEGRNIGLTLRVERLQALWAAWQDAQGYRHDSKPYRRFLDAYADCAKHNDFADTTESETDR